MLTIRRIQKGEFALYRTIRLTALKESPASFSARYDDAVQRSDESWIAQADGLALDDDKCSFIALEDDRPIGMLSLYKTSSVDSEIELMQVWVSPEHRGTGLAMTLYSKIAHWALEHGYSKIFLHSKKANDVANAFYRKCGFVVVENQGTNEEYRMEQAADRI